MPRISSQLITSGIFLAAGLVLAGAILYVSHPHFALADAAHSDWVQVEPPPGTPDGPGNLIDMGWSCSNTSNCNWAACTPSDPSYSGGSTQCDTLTCNGQSGGDGSFLAYRHSYQCIYTPATGSVCPVDDTCGNTRANTCTTDLCTATNADCTTHQVPGQKDCSVTSATLIANPATINSGDPSTLNFTCSPASPANITPGVYSNGSPVGTGNVSVSPTNTTTYTLNCFEPSAVVSSSATVTVNPTCASLGEVGVFPSCSPLPPPACVPDGACTAANTCSGSSCIDNCGSSVSGTKTTGVCAVPPPGGCTNPTVAIQAAPTRVRSGAGTRLTINGTGITTSCTVKDETGATVGSTNAAGCLLSTFIDTPPITTQKTYTVTCDGASATAKVIVNVNPVFTPF